MRSQLNIIKLIKSAINKIKKKTKQKKATVPQFVRRAIDTVFPSGNNNNCNKDKGKFHKSSHEIMSNKSIVCSSRRSSSISNSSCMLPLLLLLLLPAMPDAAAATRRARIAAPASSSSNSNNNELLTEAAATAAGKLKTTADSKYGESYIGIGMK